MLFWYPQNYAHLLPCSSFESIFIDIKQYFLTNSGLFKNALILKYPLPFTWLTSGWKFRNRRCLVLEHLCLSIKFNYYNFLLYFVHCRQAVSCNLSSMSSSYKEKVKIILYKKTLIALGCEGNYFMLELAPVNHWIGNPLKQIMRVRMWLFHIMNWIKYFQENYGNLNVT